MKCVLTLFCGIILIELSSADRPAKPSGSIIGKYWLLIIVICGLDEKDKLFVISGACRSIVPLLEFEYIFLEKNPNDSFMMTLQNFYKNKFQRMQVVVILALEYTMYSAFVYLCPTFCSTYIAGRLKGKYGTNNIQSGAYKSSSVCCFNEL